MTVESDALKDSSYLAAYPGLWLIIIVPVLFILVTFALLLAKKITKESPAVAASVGASVAAGIILFYFTALIVPVDLDKLSVDIKEQMSLTYIDMESTEHFVAADGDGQFIRCDVVNSQDSETTITVYCN